MKIILLLIISFLFGNQNPNNSSITELSLSTPDDSEDFGGVKIGEKAPAFNLKNIDGKMYSFENIKDANGNKPEGYIIIFTCNTCPVAKSNESRIKALHAKYASQGYPVVAIQPNDPSIAKGDSFDAMISNANKKGFDFLYLFDEAQEIYPQYGATKTPEVYLVDKKQIVRYHGTIPRCRTRLY